MDKYNHKEIEAKWQKKWKKDNAFKTEEKSEKEKRYILDID